MSKARTPSPEDVARLGQSLANLKAKTNPKDWARFVKTAHARGFTIAGAVSGAPDPLKERLHSSLKAQAQRTVNDSYAPDLADLSRQDSRVQNLDAKRSADNAAYQQWLLQQQATYAGAARDANAKYAGYVDKLKADTATRYDTAQTGATAAAAAVPGTVSDMSQSTALKGLEADKARAVGQVDNARLQTAALIPSVEQGLEASRQGVLASGQQREADRMNATGKALSELGDNRFKLLAGRAKDVVSEYTRLLDQEVDKSNTNRDYSAAAQKLGLEGDKLANTITQQNRDYKLKTKQLTLAELKQQDATAYHDAQIKLGYDRIAAQDGKAEADRRLRKYLHDHPAKDAKGPTAAANKYSSQLYQAVNTVQGLLADLHKSHPKGTVAPDGRPIGFREYLRGKKYSDTAIDVAEDLRKNGGKLSAAGRAKARKMGILHPESLWPVA